MDRSTIHIGLVLAAFFVLFWGVPQYFATRMVEDFQENEPPRMVTPAVIEAEIAETMAETADRAGVDEVEFLNDRGRRLRAADVEALLATDQFTHKRRASVSRTIHADELFAADETLPSGRMLELTIEARAGRLADATCASLTQTIAAECLVTGYSVSSSPHAVVGADKLYEIKTRMRFTPKGSVGEIPVSDKLVLQRRWIENVPIDFPSLEPAGITAGLLSALNRAVFLCDQIRATHGNCVIAEFVTRLPAIGQPERRLRFELHYLTPLAVAADE